MHRIRASFPLTADAHRSPSQPTTLRRQTHSHIARYDAATMDAIYYTYWLLGGAAALVLAGIGSSLLARRFGAPLLLVFLVIGMLAGVDGPGRHPLRRLRADLSPRLVCARGDPVRRRSAHAPRGISRRARADAVAGDTRRRHHGRTDRRGRALAARSWDRRLAAARCGGGVDRRGRGVFSVARRRTAAPLAHRRNARDRIERERSGRRAADDAARDLSGRHRRILVDWRSRANLRCSSASAVWLARRAASRSPPPCASCRFPAASRRCS